jgi:NAD(P)-dependent dehydrogenase (short-subunit alcohol dehydrogenase family)
VRVDGTRPPRSLEDETALVVGGGRGIGAATAMELGRRGATVMVAARSETEVRRVSQQVREDGGRAIPWVADARITEDVESMVDELRRRTTTIDHVVYCAGYLPEAGLVWDLDVDELRDAFEVHVVGPVLVARNVVPVMLDQGWGTIVFVSSALPTWAFPALGIYCSSRAAENALVRTLEAEVRGSGVRIELFTPPPTRTQALATFRSGLAGRRPEVPGQPASEPEEVAADIVRLCVVGGRAPAHAARWVAARSRCGTAESPISPTGWQRPW